MKRNRISIFSLTAVLVLGLATVAFADGGWGYGSRMGIDGDGAMMGSGYGSHMDGAMMGSGYGGHMMERGNTDHMHPWDAYDGPHHHDDHVWNNLSSADAARMKVSQERFYQNTRVLRDRINAKASALDREMNKLNPNRDRVLRLRKELSDLQGQFDQKAVAHRLDVHKLLHDNHYQGNGYGYEGR